MDFAKGLEQCPLVAILRGISVEEVKPVCQALYEEGFRVLEIPLNTPRALDCIALASEYAKGRMAVGAGTVLEPEEVGKVKEAGGTFIISPNCYAPVIQETKRLNMVSIPGVFTATEAFDALRAGADFLKLFPATLGPDYVKALKAVVKAPFLAVGGVNADNLKEMLRVCAGAGIGSALYKPGKTIEEIQADARRLRAREA